jgi:metal-responsive CopG/Arc/MetJ family transcriptional regulator
MVKKNYHEHQFSVRPDDELITLMDEWMKKNPGWSKNQLANQAIRQFITKKQELTPVEEKKESK